MRVWLSAALLLLAVNVQAADPVYIDALMETSHEALQQQFPSLKKEGCYRIGEDRFLLIAIDAKAKKPWRVAVGSGDPCRRAERGPEITVAHRSGIALGDATPAVIEKLGRPDASAQPDPALQRLGTTEYFYICRVSEGCARHTSIFIRDGRVSGIAEWYSD